MNRWYAGLIALLICGCDSNSNSDLVGGGAEELDGGASTAGTHKSPLGIDLETMRSSPLFHEFDVDLFSSDPIQRVTQFNISSADTYKISLQTLDLLTEEKRFTLVHADKIIQNGLPKVIAPIGYTVSLEVSGNQVVAVIKSTTGPDVVVRPVPINMGNNDIIVGDVGSLNLLFSGVQQELCVYAYEAGVTHAATAFNRYVRYNTTDQWHMQVAKRRVGFDTTMSAHVGKTLSIFDHSALELSIQHLYGLKDSKHINAASLKYSTYYNGSGIRGSGIQGYVVASTLLSLTPISAVGGVCSVCPSVSSRLVFGVVMSHIDWNASIDFVLDL
jgi:hypothetical protein